MGKLRYTERRGLAKSHMTRLVTYEIRESLGRFPYPSSIKRHYARRNLVPVRADSASNVPSASHLILWLCLSFMDTWQFNVFAAPSPVTMLP